MVPSARLELAQLSPLPPQDSVSTNFTTTALQTYTGDFLPMFKFYFGICWDFDSVFPSAAPLVAGAGDDGAGAGAGDAGTAPGTVAGALAGAGTGIALESFASVFAGSVLAAGAVTPSITPPPITPPLIFGAWKYVSPKLVAKNSAAHTPVDRDKKFAAPEEPNKLPAEPLPKAAPISAPLPCCNSTKTIMAKARMQ
jgi:hypothetical protein